MNDNISEQEEALLRSELVRARKVMDAAMEGWAENSRALTKENQRQVEEINQYRETVRDQDAQIKDLARQLAAYENRTSPSGKAASSRKIKKRGNRSPPSSS